MTLGSVATLALLIVVLAMIAPGVVWTLAGLLVGVLQVLLTAGSDYLVVFAGLAALLYGVATMVEKGLRLFGLLAMCALLVVAFSLDITAR